MADGKRWQEALHIPLLPAVQSYLTHLAGVASDGTDSDEEAVLLPGREPMTQRQYFQAMAARLAECPAGELLAAIHGRSWPRDFLGRFTAAVTGGLSPAADALTPSERIEAARQLAAEIARLAHRNLAPRKIVEETIADPATAAAGVPVAEMARALAMALDAQQRGDWAAAAELWARVRTLAPNEPAGYGFGAEVAKNLGQVAEADDILAVGVGRFPTDHGLAADFANLAAHRRAWAEALTRWSQFRSRFPTHPAGFVGAAWAFREQGQLDLAEVLLGEAVQRFPDQKLFVYKLAYTTLTGDELARLHAAVRGYGPAPLLYVRYANAEHPDGTVERVKPGLLVGYLDHFGVASDDQSLTSPVDSWEVICERAYDLWKSGGDEGVDDDQAPAAAPLPMIGNPVTQPPVRWELDLIARMQAEADDPAGHPINRRLRDIMARAGRGEPVAGLRRRLEDVATEYPAAYLSDPWFYDNYALTCMTAGAFDLASSLVRDRFRADWACEPVIEAGGNLPPVMRWNVVSRSHSRFLFEPAAFAGEITIGVLLSWARSMPLYDGYHRSDELACGTANVSLFDAGIAPGIAFCGNRPDHLLVPDMEYLYRDGHSAVRAEIDAHSQPWEQRQPVAYWRGSTTGHWDGKDWHTLPRIRLCDIGAGSGGLIDAGLSGIVQMEPQVAEEIAGSGLLKGSVPPARFADYRCLVDIDGNSNSWSGLFYRLYTGSTVLKVDSPFNFRLWFYDRLVPWHNYVPVASDMSDLLEKVEWLRRNDEVARDIGQRGRELAVSLDYETEVMGAAKTITAALRQELLLAITLSGRPRATPSRER